jgi:serine/threonine-protein kinase RsbW
MVSRHAMQRRILIIDDHNDLAEALDEVFTHTGHEVKIVQDRKSALALGNIDTYDLVITDLDGENAVPDPTLFNGRRPVCMASDVESPAGDHVKAFKICATHFRRDEWDEQELKDLVATTLDYKIRFVDKVEYVRDLHENIEFELPSAMSLMHIVLDYLMRRVERQGVVKSEQSNLFVALDEAFVNAIKHGNKFDATKLIRVAAEVSRHEARFTIEDEGEGFDVYTIPDPLDPENLFKTSGRGVLFIYNIMDEVQYNDRGNRLTMVKKSDLEKA